MSSKFRVYVAAAFGDYQRARLAMTGLRCSNIGITFDWTVDAGRPGADKLPPNLSRACAELDLAGVRDADALLLLTPQRKGEGCGCWIELGAALALNKPVFIAGKQRERSVFAFLTENRYATDLEAITALCYLARPREDAA
jgi:nucleoside 2-deoxyribosyltransferase